MRVLGCRAFEAKACPGLLPCVKAQSFSVKLLLPSAECTPVSLFGGLCAKQWDSEVLLALDQCSRKNEGRASEAAL